MVEDDDFFTTIALSRDRVEQTIRDRGTAAAIHHVIEQFQSQRRLGLDEKWKIIKICHDTASLSV